MPRATKNAPSDALKGQLAEFHNLPLIREDDPRWDMGEINLHALAEHILRYGIAAHLVPQPELCVFSNLNLYYQPRFPTIYVSPDVMVVKPRNPRQEDVRTYVIGRDGPAPLAVAEVLSEESAEDSDLVGKAYIYSMIGVSEYILVDPSGEYLPERLLLKRLARSRQWKDHRDADGGITSRLGFRVVWETEHRLRVVDAKTGYRYVWPDKADQRIQALEAELARLKGQGKE
jgi:Uma2 family endonuclease